MLINTATVHFTTRDLQCSPDEGPRSAHIHAPIRSRRECCSHDKMSPTLVHTPTPIQIDNLPISLLSLSQTLLFVLYLEPYLSQTLIFLYFIPNPYFCILSQTLSLSLYRDRKGGGHDAVTVMPWLHGKWLLSQTLFANPPSLSLYRGCKGRGHDAATAMLWLHGTWMWCSIRSGYGP